MAYDFGGGSGSPANDTFLRVDASLNGAIPCKSSGGAQEFTAMGWCDPDVDGSRLPIMSKQQIASIIRGFMLDRGSSNKANFEVAKDNSTVTSLLGTTDALAGTWRHYAGTYKFVTDGTSIMKVYLDGVPEGTTSTAVGPPNPNAVDLMIGKYLNNSTMNGTLEQIRIYDRVLTDAEIQTIHACRGVDGIVAGLILNAVLLQDAPGVNAAGDQIDASNQDNDMAVSNASTMANTGALRFRRHL